MAYGAEAHTGFIKYQLILEHTPSGVRLDITVDPFKADGTTPTEAARDAVFQTFLTRLGGMSNVTVISSTKTGQFATPVTP